MDDASAHQDSILICPKCLTQYPPGTSRCEQDGTELKLLVVDQEETLVGQTIDGRWVMERKIGVGGMGTVYLANQINIERRVAIKTMHRGLARGHEFLERFLREANVASQVSHPHLVSNHDFGQTSEGDLFIVMEYLDGENLGERMQRARLSLSQTIKIAAQLCAALAAAHGAGIVHRDLKPDNIFLLHMPGDDIFIKLLDFGIAKHMNSQAMTQTGQVFGTPDYMSPEQCRGKSNIDHRSDLYALGCILYELISGKTPFASESMIQVLFRHVSDPVPQLVSTVDDPSLAAVEQIITRLLQKKPRKRYATALEVREALDAALAQLDHPELLMPAWRTIEDEEQSKASTARLGDVTQEELEHMMLEELSDTSEAEEVDDVTAMAFVDTQDELPSVHSRHMTDVIKVEPIKESAEEIAEQSAHSRSGWLIAIASGVLVVAGVIAYQLSRRDIEPVQDVADFGRAVALISADMPADVSTMDLVSINERVASGSEPAPELVSSAISTAQLLLHSNAHRRAEAIAQKEGKRLARKPTRPIKPDKPNNRDNALLTVRTRTSMTRRIDRASSKALKCLDTQLLANPERYVGHVGDRFKIRVMIEITPTGEVKSVSTTQTSGKTVKDDSLMSCIKLPYSKLKFSAVSPLQGNVSQGAELTFKLRRD